MKLYYLNYKHVKMLVLKKCATITRKNFFNTLVTTHFIRTYSQKLTVKRALQIVPNQCTSVTVQGWVKAVRKHKENIFLHIGDGSCLNHLQIVVANSSCFPSAAVTFGSCVRVVGNLVQSEKPQQAVEVVCERIEVLGGCDFMSYPIKAHTRHSSDYLRQNVHLRSRTASFGAMLRVRNAAAMAIHKYFQDKEYCLIQTPILTSNDCEGAGEVFMIEPVKKSSSKTSEQNVGDNKEHFFDVPTFLTVSGQLHLEVINGGFSKVYAFGPTFRADNSRTRHHLSEFNMVEAEMSFTESLDDVMKVIEDLIKFTTKQLLESCSEDVEFIVKFAGKEGQKQLKPFGEVAQKPFIRLSYNEAISVLEKHETKFINKPSWGIDLYKEHERFLVEHCGDGVPVFVTDFPATIKPFYARVNDDERTVAAVDLLAPGVGEICGGSLREERLEVLERRIADKSVKGDLDWYLDLRRFGSAQHGGFGVGFERFLQTLLGVQNIRDVIPFPRTANNCQL